MVNGMSKNKLGKIAFIGSGETSQSGGKVIEELVQSLPDSPRVVVLETPAGFELNSHQVAGRIADYYEKRLQNYNPEVIIVPARKRGTDYSPDDPEIIAPLLTADVIFMGPGSPTYNIRQLRGSLAWDVLRARHRMGAVLVFASAAVISVGSMALPVYEIFKVGEDVHTKPGLDLFSDFGVSLSFVTHWNNNEGGEDLDTSRCFVGKSRFDEWYDLLPDNHMVVGIDEHTSLIIDFGTEQMKVVGIGEVTILKGKNKDVVTNGQTSTMAKLGQFDFINRPDRTIPRAVWDMITQAESTEGEEQQVPANVVNLAKEREQARDEKNWSKADAIREKIEALGWQVQDTPDGPHFNKNK